MLGYANWSVYMHVYQVTYSCAVTFQYCLKNLRLPHLKVHVCPLGKIICSDGY